MIKINKIEIDKDTIVIDNMETYAWYTWSDVMLNLRLQHLSPAAELGLRRAIR